MNLYFSVFFSISKTSNSGSLRFVLLIYTFDDDKNSLQRSGDQKGEGGEVDIKSPDAAECVEVHYGEIMNSLNSGWQRTRLRLKDRLLGLFALWKV